MNDQPSNQGTFNPGDDAGEQMRANAPEESETLPAKIGKYAIRSRIGGGTFGLVLKGYDPDLHSRSGDQSAALIYPLLRKYSTNSCAKLRSARQIKHQFVCEIYEVGQDGNRPFIVMLLDRRRHSADRMARQPELSGSGSFGIVRDVAIGRHAAHRKGIIHRDREAGRTFFSTKKPLRADRGFRLA